MEAKTVDEKTRLCSIGSSKESGSLDRDGSISSGTTESPAHSPLHTTQETNHRRRPPPRRKVIPKPFRRQRSSVDNSLNCTIEDLQRPCEEPQTQSAHRCDLVKNESIDQCHDSGTEEYNAQSQPLVARAKHKTDAQPSDTRIHYTDTHQPGHSKRRRIISLCSGSSKSDSFRQDSTQEDNASYWSRQNSSAQEDKSKEWCLGYFYRGLP